MKKIVDERQEMDMLKVEHIGFWVMFWGLFAAITIQTILYPTDLKKIVGEMIIFIISCIVVLIGDIRKGVWDYYTEPTLKNYFLYSIAFGILIWIIDGAIMYKNIYNLSNNIAQLIIRSGINALKMFPIFFITLFICGTIVKKRRKKLEQELEDNDL